MANTLTQFSGTLIRLPAGPSMPVALWRWAVSCLIAAQLVFAFMHQALRPRARLDAPVSMAPVALDLVELPPPPRVRPVVKPEKGSKPNPAPKAAQNPPRVVKPVSTPIAPSDHVQSPADVLSAPVQQEQAVRIRSAAQLDNIEFEPIFTPKPAYPPVALEAGIEGWVDTDLVVSEQGWVDKFFIVRVTGHPAFAREVSKVLKRWRFPPPRVGGQQMRVKYYYRIKFRLN